MKQPAAKTISPKFWLPALAVAAVAATFLFSYFSFDSAAGLWQFAGALLLCFLAPGYLLLRLTGTAGRIPAPARIILSLALGLVVTSSLFYLTSLAHLQCAFIPVLAVSGCVVLVLALREGGLHLPRLRVTKGRIIFACLALAIVICAIPASFTSGRQYEDGMRFYGYHSMDSMWHLARIAEMEHTVPPRDPMDAGSLLAYHVLYHSAVNALHRVSRVNFIDIHFRLMPVFMLLLFASLLYITVKRISGKRAVALWALALFFFAGDLGFIFLARKAAVDPSQGPGGLSAALDRAVTIRNRGDMYYELQAFDGNTFSNVFWSETTLISLVLLFAGLYLLSECASWKRKGFRWMFSGPAILAALCIGAMMQAKVQVGALALGGLFVAAIYSLLMKKDFTYLKFFVIALVIALVFTIPWLVAFTHEDPLKWTEGGTAARPLVTVTNETVMNQICTIAILPSIDAFRGVEHAVLLLQVAVWFLFVVFSFGGRIIGVPFMLGAFGKKRGNTLEVFLAVMVVAGLLIAHFTKIFGETLFSSHFICGMMFINYFGAKGMAWLGEKRATLLRALLVIMMIPMPLFKFVSEMPRHNLYAVVNRSEQELYARLRTVTSPDAVILRRFESDFVLRDETGERTSITLGDSFLMAFAGRRVAGIQEKGYRPDSKEDLETQLKKSPKWRDIYAFFRTEDRDEAREILRRYGVTHVLLYGGEELRFDGSEMFEEIFRNDAGRILRVKDLDAEAGKTDTTCCGTALGGQEFGRRG